VSTNAHLRAEKAACAAGDEDSRPTSLSRAEATMGEHLVRRPRSQRRSAGAFVTVMSDQLPDLPLGLRLWWLSGSPPPPDVPEWRRLLVASGSRPRGCDFSGCRRFS
jgi:hypothetical protein